MHLFVYGTLRPGDVRWHFLEPFVVDGGWDDTVAGSVFDTGLGYPAAVFDRTDGESGDVGAVARSGSVGTIHGRTYALLESSRQRCLDVLDDVEGVVDGEYRRVAITTGTGARAWAYSYGSGLDLTLIESGDWLCR